MYSHTFLSVLLGITSVHAGALRRDIEPFPSSTYSVGSITTDPAAQASAYNDGLSLSESPPDDGDVETDSIRLVNFDGCSDMPGVTNAEAQIYSGWQQAQKIMAVQALKDGAVDFNTAGALEYLGAAGLNQPRQGDMNTIFKNYATLTPAYWPFGWRIHVRCDDPWLQCTCGPSTAFAYTTNKDEDSGLARINFCPRYFTTPTLNSAIDDAQTLPNSQKYDMNRYWETQGHAFTHEVMHIDWVTGAYGPNGRYGNNEHVTDMKIRFTDSNGKPRQRTAYGPESAKILARWPTNTGDYTIRNADNLALFMTSQYVQSQLNNAYPQYPLVDVDQPSRPPWDPYGSLFLFGSDGSVTINATNPLAAAFADADAAECPTDQDEPNPDPVAFTSFAPDSAYPTDYVSSLADWLATETDAPDSVMTESPALSTSSAAAGDPYCIPFQDPDNGISGYCQCTDGNDFSFTSGDNPCPYTSPGPSSATIDPATITGTLSTPAPPPPTSTPTPTSSAPPANGSPVIGDPCTPDNPEWGCSSDSTQILYCYCGDGNNCVWTSFGTCENNSATCHVGDDCGFVGACC